MNGLSNVSTLVSVALITIAAVGAMVSWADVRVSYQAATLASMSPASRMRMLAAHVRVRRETTRISCHVLFVAYGVLSMAINADATCSLFGAVISGLLVIDTLLDRFDRDLLSAVDAAGPSPSDSP